MLTNILMAFIPVFVAVDAIGTLPILLLLTQGLDRRLKHRIILQSMLTALCLAVGSILVGKLVFRALGILMGAFLRGDLPSCHIGTPADRTEDNTNSFTESAYITPPAQARGLHHTSRGRSSPVETDVSNEVWT